MWCPETIEQINDAIQIYPNHRQAAEVCGVRVLGDQPRSSVRYPHLVHAVIQNVIGLPDIERNEAMDDLRSKQPRLYVRVLATLHALRAEVKGL